MTGDKTPNVGREDRKELTLDVLAESGCAMPTKVIARNVKLRGGTFEESSVRRYLEELLQEGKVTKLDPEQIDDRQIVEVEKSDSGYWIASQEARERFNLNG